LSSLRGGIDLHTHSTASDGTDTPGALIAKAASLGLSTIALTDHDTISGVSEADAAAKEHSIELIPGVELSIEDGDIRRFHLLSYFFDVNNPALTSTLEGVRRWRSDRNALMLERAQAEGIDLTFEEVLDEAGEGATVIGRPHFAAALVKKGLASSINDAFDKYLKTDRPLHVAKPSLTLKAAAELLHAAGGITILAHPGLIRWAQPAELAVYIKDLKNAGLLDGIECYYFRYDDAQTEFFLGLAHENSLLVSGGSDYHGGNKPDVPLGSVHHGSSLSPSILDPLREASRLLR